jgi:hypothetical protein
MGHAYRRRNFKSLSVVKPPSIEPPPYWPWGKAIVAMVQYAALALVHKYFVMRAGWWTRAQMWRLLIHDWSKFMPTELPYYARKFFGDDKDPEGWAWAWLHHQNANPHHWEYWVKRSPSITSLRMPEWAIREMVADWLAASRAYSRRWPTLTNWPWLERELPRLRERLHPETYVSALALVSYVLDEQHPVKGKSRILGVRREGELFPYGLSVQWWHGPRLHLHTPRSRRTFGFKLYPSASWLDRFAFEYLYRRPEGR